MTDSAPRAVDLAPLVATLDGARVTGDLDRVVVGIAADSRTVAPGYAFVAVRGERSDGHEFVAAAVAAGAIAVVVDEAYASAHAPHPGTTTVAVADTRRALSRLAASFYDRPSGSLAVVGITGTNGKTTTAHFVETVLCAGGVPAGRIGTLGAALAGATWPLENTTPLPIELHRLLAEMRDRGAHAVALEVSSHALALARADDVDVAVGVLTNVTRDHLDFHGTFEAYAAAKRTLFERATRAVIGIDDPLGRRWAGELATAGRGALTYGFAADAQVRADAYVARPDGADFTVDGRRFAIRLPGRFNVSNALAAVGVARTLGVADAATAEALWTVERIPGRMERFAAGGVDVLVDYAHTPDALDAVTRSARDLARGRLIVVFGCGGDRDRGKRPEMGRIASLAADRVYLTNDNPRREDPAAIARDVLAGVASPDVVVVEPDRRAAIRRAVADARPGDVVVIAGKGHETYQLVAGEMHRFDDREEVQAALAARTDAS